MKNKKLIILALVTVLVFSLVTIGCADKVTPKESAQVLWNIKIKNDATGIEKLGLSEESGKELMETSRKGEIQLLRTACVTSGLTATEQQLEDVYDALMDACVKNTVEIEEVSKSGDVAEVKITSTYIDEVAISTEAANDAVEVIQNMQITSQNEALNKATELYIQNLIDGFKNAEVSTETTEKTFKFVKNDGYWLPESNQTFIQDISKMATNQK